LAYRRQPLAEITINLYTPWSIEVHGGISSFAADLGLVRLSGLELHGGISHLWASLPEPAGTMAIRIGGGVSDMIIHRPADVTVRVRLRGGINSLTLDEQHFGAMGGQPSLETPGYNQLANRYDIQISSGASNIVTKMTKSKPKSYRGIGMEGFIAFWYAISTEKDLEEYKKLAERVVVHIEQGNSILEVAPGPGYLAIELAKLEDFDITGLDISVSFVEIAQKKATDAGVEVAFRQGDVAAIPFREGSFDFIVCRAAFKNFSEPVKALREMYRVMKPGGGSY
jgi:hypothetical protein